MGSEGRERVVRAGGRLLRTVAPRRGAAQVGAAQAAGQRRPRPAGPLCRLRGEWGRAGRSGGGDGCTDTAAAGSSSRRLPCARTGGEGNAHGD